MNRINVYIPIAEGQKIAAEVMQPLEAMPGGVTAIVCNTPAIPRKRRAGEANSRNMCLRMIRESITREHDVIHVMMDSDIVHLRNDNFFDMAEFLRVNTAFAGVDLFRIYPQQACKKFEPVHVRMSCPMLRNDVWLRIEDFKNDTTGCFCPEFSAQVRRYGRYGYVRGLPADCVVEMQYLKRYKEGLNNH